MIRITLSAAAYAALASAIRSGLRVHQERAPNGEYYVWVDRPLVDRLRALRGPREFLQRCHLASGGGERRRVRALTFGASGQSHIPSEVNLVRQYNA